MKKIFLSILAFSLYGASTFAQSAEVKSCAEKTAEVYCTCEGMTKAVDLKIAVLDGKISEADANAQIMALMLDMQECSFMLNEEMGKLEPTTAAHEQAEMLMLKVMNEKYPDCAKKIARLTEKK
jgi:hypothetical protein